VLPVLLPKYQKLQKPFVGGLMLKMFDNGEEGILDLGLIRQRGGRNEIRLFYHQKP
jgi:hypothetical protein